MKHGLKTVNIEISSFEDSKSFSEFGICIEDPLKVLVAGIIIPTDQQSSFCINISNSARHCIATLRWRSDLEAETVVAEVFCGQDLLIERRRFIYGRLNDGPQGEPAVECFDVQGGLRMRCYYSNGVLQDGRNGEPGWTDYYSESGRIYLIQRFLAGDLNDGPNGEPAYQQLDEDGTVRDTVHYHRGVEKDPATVYNKAHGQIRLSAQPGKHRRRSQCKPLSSKEPQ